jgi:caa(3)-type oxidase subunit IV
VVALGIAAVKAGLIVLFFMEAHYSPGLVAVAALLWFGLLLGGTLDDVVTRGWLAVPGK